MEKEYNNLLIKSCQNLLPTEYSPCDNNIIKILKYIFLQLFLVKLIIKFIIFYF
mgnify:CR=1 FL=1